MAKHQTAKALKKSGINTDAVFAIKSNTKTMNHVGGNVTIAMELWR